MLSRSRMRTGRLSMRERLDDLLPSPGRRRMVGHIEMQHLATTMFQHDKYEQHLHRERRHGKKVGRYYLTDMVVQESLPGLVRRPAELSQNPGHGTHGDGDAEHFQLAMNPGRAPQRIGRGHLFDESAEFCSGAGTTSTTTTRLRQPRPESSGPFALPSHHRVCLDIHQGMSLVGPHAAEH